MDGRHTLRKRVHSRMPCRRPLLYAGQLAHYNMLELNPRHAILADVCRLKHRPQTSMVSHSKQTLYRHIVKYRHQNFIHVAGIDIPC